MANAQLPQFSDELKLKVASPCPALWSDMAGDDRTRFCDSCKKNVYNISGMSRDDAFALIEEREGDVCVRFYQRPDGTVLTADCKIGVAAVARRLKRMCAALLAFLGVFAIVGIVESTESNGIAGAKQTPTSPLRRLLGWTQRPELVVGRLCLPAMPPAPAIPTTAIPNTAIPNTLSDQINSAETADSNQSEGVALPAESTPNDEGN
jgi:hypothetical protein